METKQMVEISATMVKDLREKTGAAMMDCKHALVEANGDFEKACEILRQKGINVANKKSSRVAMDGLVAGLISEDNQAAVLLEVNCETDFVARNEEFVSLTKRLCETALQIKAATVEDFLKAKVTDTTVENIIAQAIGKTGENIIVRRLTYLNLNKKPGFYGLYIHSQGGKIGALVQFETSGPVGDNALGREIAMHVVFAKPQYLGREDVPINVVENEKRIESGKADLADKKPEIREKIIAGRVEKIFGERCLMEQPFVRDQSISVEKHIQEQSKQLKVDIKPSAFSLFILGEVEAANGQSN
jgi:elongation factor Ts